MRWVSIVEVRKWPGWYRHITLTLPTRSWPSLARAPARSAHRGHGSLTGGLGLLPLTVPAVGRLLVALVWIIPVRPGFVLA
jgi:hypothetical protein